MQEDWNWNSHWSSDRQQLSLPPIASQLVQVLAQLPVVGQGLEHSSESAQSKPGPVPSLGAHYAFGKLIGRGSFGDVWLAYQHLTGQRLYFNVWAAQIWDIGYQLLSADQRVACHPGQQSSSWVLTALKVTLACACYRLPEYPV